MSPPDIFCRAGVPPQCIINCDTHEYLSDLHRHHDSGLHAMVDTSTYHGQTNRLPKGTPLDATDF